MSKSVKKLTGLVAATFTPLTAEGWNISFLNKSITESFAWGAVIWSLICSSSLLFSREIDLSVIGPYIDYLIEKQNVKSVFSKSNLFI